MAEERIKSGNYAVGTPNHADYHPQCCVGYQPPLTPVTPENIDRLISEFENRNK